MGVPKRKKSHARSRTRRSHRALAPANVSPCPKCGAPRMPHRVCGQCGYYNEKITLEKKE